MGKKYVSEFYDIKSRLYKIEIETEKGNGTSNFKLGGTPLTTKMSSEGKHLYSPIKTTGATITMLTDAYNFDLYTGKAQGSKVTITSDNRVIWVGYLTPCCYDMGFDSYWEEIELECVDGIAVLKYIPFEGGGNNGDIDTFFNIISKCLSKSNCLKNLYITNNIQLTENGNDSIIEKLKVSQQNFFNERKESTQTNDDLAWNCYDVLKEIMQFMGATIYADGEDVFVIDYDAINHNQNTYYKYSLLSGEPVTPEVVELKSNYKIDGESYASSGTKISLDNVYNKVSVKDEFYKYDKIFPEFTNEKLETNITQTTDDPYMKQNNWLSDIFDRQTKNGDNISFQIFSQATWKKRAQVVIMKFYDSPILKFHKYADVVDINGRVDMTDAYKNMCYGKLFETQGATYYKYWKREVKSSDYEAWRKKYPSDWYSQSVEERYAAWCELLNQKPETISLSPVILCLRPDVRGSEQNPIKRNEMQYYPFIVYSSTNSVVLGGEGAYLTINGSSLFHDEYYSAYPISDGADNGKLNHKDYGVLTSDCYHLALLKWGDLYWNGEDWITEETTFELKFGDFEGRPFSKIQDVFDKFEDFYDVTNKDIDVNDSAKYYIPMPKDTLLSGNVTFAIYATHNYKGFDNPFGEPYYRNNVTIIKDLQLEAKIKNGLLNDFDNSSDTVYTNVIDNGSVDAMGEIKFKICTFDNKSPNYSSVFYEDKNGSLQFLTKTINKALNAAQKDSKSSFDGKQYLTMEEHLIYKLVTQYENPRIIMECNLKNEGHKLYGLFTDKTLNNRNFVANTISTDYKMNTQTIKLIEKA